LCIHQLRSLSVQIATSLEQLQQCSVCDPAKIFLTSIFSYLLFSNPAHKTKTGTANRWETTNSNPTGPIVMICKSDHNYYTLLFRLCCAFCHLSKLWENAVPKPFCWAKLACSDFWFPGSHTEHHWSCSYSCICNVLFVLYMSLGWVCCAVRHAPQNLVLQTLASFVGAQDLYMFVICQVWVVLHTR
jgi:hypothetical protein